MFTAGTDANVYFQLIGSEGETEKIQLRQGGKAEKRFEKGRLDKFIVETVDVGTVRLSHFFFFFFNCIYQFLRFLSWAQIDKLIVTTAFGVVYLQKDS